MSNHIDAEKGDIASVVLMPGDIKRCEFIAKTYLTGIKIVNTIRANVAYTGYYKKHRITIFPSGMGIGSMGIYSYELYKEYEVENIIRIGTCGCYDDNIKIGSLFLCNKSYSKSAYYKELFDNRCHTTYPSKMLNDWIKETAETQKVKLEEGGTFTVEAFYSKKALQLRTAKKHSLSLADMETFALFSNAEYFKKNASSILTVSDIIVSSKQKNLTAEEREKKLNNMFILALETAYKLSYKQ